MERGAERFVLNQCPVDAVERLQGESLHWSDVNIAVGQDAVGLGFTILSTVDQTHGVVVEHLDGIVSLTQVLWCQGRAVDASVLIVGRHVRQVDVGQTGQAAHGAQRATAGVVGRVDLAIGITAVETDLHIFIQVVGAVALE